jgi:hypothetical protein
MKMNRYALIAVAGMACAAVGVFFTTRTQAPPQIVERDGMMWIPGGES